MILLLLGLIALTEGDSPQSVGLLEDAWKVDLYAGAGAEKWGLLHLPRAALVEALVQLVEESHEPLVLECQGAWVWLVSE